MTTEGVRRKLAAILCADVEGYSRLIQDDPEATLATLSRSRSIFDECSKCLNGRVVDSPGDNILIEFASVSEAVQCAVEIQHKLAQQNTELVGQRRMRFRIGIDVGDVLEKDGALYGNGVNISARLQALIEGGGVCISGAAYDQVVNHVPYKFEFIGKKTVKNIETPIRVYRVLDQPAYTIQQPMRGKRKITPAWRTALAAVAVLILLAGAAGWYYYVNQPKQVTIDEKPSIAVLPFTNMSGDPEQEYFSDGMTEELINALSKLEGLKVISRTSAFYFKGKDLDLRAMGAQLGVEHILEGSVRKSGNQLRITAQLIKVSDDTHLWSETYDREMQAVFAIQDDISRMVVNTIAIKLIGNKGKPYVRISTGDMEAYDLYLKGRHLIMTESKAALGYFEKAIEIDTSYALAYAGLAQLFANAFYNNLNVSRAEAYKKALAAANKALELDNNLAEAHACLGTIQVTFEWDWKAAEKSYKKALMINPGSSDAHYWYSGMLACTGRAEESISESRLSLSLDPLSPFANSGLGLALCYARQFDPAIDQYERTLVMFPKNFGARLVLAIAYNAKKMHGNAIGVLQRGLEDFPKNWLLLGNLAFTYGLSGETKKARQILSQMIEASKTGYVPATPIAKIYAVLGDIDKAFEYLQKAYDSQEVSGLAALKVMPDFDVLRSDPRFDELLEKMGLAD